MPKTSGELERFRRKRGYWPDEFDAIVKTDPSFFEAAAELINHPWERDVLGRKLKELILIAINASVTHMHEPAVRHHIRSALDAGATEQEIIEVLELTSVLGIHSCISSVPILAAESTKTSKSEPATTLTPRQLEIKEKFRRERGYWSDQLWGVLLALDPEYLEKYTNYSGHPWKKGVLPPKMKEFIYIAIDASTTHLYEPGIRQHVQNALRYSATPQEILEILEVAVEIGLQTCSIGFRILSEERAKG